MLTAIRKALALISEEKGQTFTIQDVPQEDPATYAMLQKGDSIGVFQVESRAQINMLPRLKPETYYDLVIEVAIVRPGPIQGDMVHPYLRRKHGLEAVDYPNDAVRQVLERTLGVPIFQEQVIKLAMVAAGFSAGEADKLRRAMAAWKPHGDLTPFRDKLISGMLERGHDPDFAERLYQQICGFGGYGFPESHAASFALLVYVSAWIKRHHPAAFYCALLNSQPMGFYTPSQLVQDAQRHQVTVLPPDVNHSAWEHTLQGKENTCASASESYRACRPAVPNASTRTAPQTATKAPPNCAPVPASTSATWNSSPAPTPCPASPATATRLTGSYSNTKNRQNSSPTKPWPITPRSPAACSPNPPKARMYWPTTAARA